MNRLTINPSRTIRTRLASCVVICVVSIILATNAALDYPALLLLPLSYLCLVITTNLGYRFSTESALPRGILHLHALNQGCLVPVAISLEGLAQGTLPYLPQNEYVNDAIILTAASQLGLNVGLVMHRIGRRDSPRGANSKSNGYSVLIISPIVLILYTIIGIFGFWLTFGDLGTLVTYYTTPSTREATVMAQDATLAQAVGTFTRPFLAIATCLCWLKLSQSQTSSSSSFLRSVWLLCLFAPMLFVITMSFGYNRGYFISLLIPLIALMQRRFAAPSTFSLVLIGFPLVLGMAILGSYRSSQFTLDSLINDRDASDMLYQNVRLSESFQVYSNAPQFTGFLLQATDKKLALQLGATLIASALSPVPIIGKTFRAASGPALYNATIYDDNTTIDQIVPLYAELYLNFGYLGVVVGFALLGYLLSQVNARFNKSSSVVDGFLWAYLGYWLAFQCVASVAILAQVIIFFFPPVILLHLIAKYGFLGRALPLSAR